MTALTVVKGGINRDRTKGAARPDVLYDLLNGYVTNENTVQVRPGTFRRNELPAETKGLCAFAGKLHTFCHVPIDVPDNFILHVLVHPMFDGGTENSFPLKKIHFAAPFLGFLYVAAEFDVGDVDTDSVFHYWLQTSGPWQANKVYRAGDVVEPTVPNGLAYRAGRLGAANPSWAPNVARTVGDVIEPTVYNDFFYTVVDTLGANPASGTVEPDWPTEDGARITEDTDADAAPPQLVTVPPERRPIQDVTDRYGDPGPNNGAQP